MRPGHGVGRGRFGRDGGKVGGDGALRAARRQGFRRERAAAAGRAESGGMDRDEAGKAERFVAYGDDIFMAIERQVGFPIHWIGSFSSN